LRYHEKVEKLQTEIPSFLARKEVLLLLLEKNKDLQINDVIQSINKQKLQNEIQKIQINDAMQAMNKQILQIEIQTLQINDALKSTTDTIQAMSGINQNIKDKTIAILGLTFKPETDDVRDSTSIIIAEYLSKEGAIINAYDPQGMENAKILLPNINYSDSIQSSCVDADAIIIATEWNEFRALNIKKLKEQMNITQIFRRRVARRLTEIRI
jgi:UDP-glucose 6-dehydrogenase